MTRHLITLMVFLPFLGAILQAVLPKTQLAFGKFSASRWAALLSSLASSLCGIFLVISMQNLNGEISFHENVSWIGSYAISYDMGLDGLNALVVLLISIIFPLLIASEWMQKTGIRGLFGLFLLLQFCFLGTVCAQDLFLVFFFWALSSLPFYFLIGIWGGELKEQAAFRTIVASTLGNTFLFASLILVYYAVDPHTFSLHELVGGKLNEKTFEFLGNNFNVSGVAFSLMAIGLALRAPVWPFHGWFTLAVQEAPSSVFVALSAVAVPVATYIFMRLAYSLFPVTLLQNATTIVMVGTVSLVMGGVCALAQKGLRLLAAFICLSEVGLVLIGIGSTNPIGIVGSSYQQLVLGLGLAGLGLLTGILYERSGTVIFQAEDGTASQGGVVNFAPRMAVVAGVVIASLLGFPGLGGFVGHALLLIGSYSIHPVVVVIAAIIFIFTSYFLFSMYRFVFLGKPREESVFADLTFREGAFLYPLIASLVVFGLYPKPWIDLVRPTVVNLLTTLK